MQLSAQRSLYYPGNTSDSQPTCERGDLLAVLPDTGLVVADASAVHPAAASYRRWASATHGAAAATRDQEERT
jgi:hypothetical protein